MAIPQFFIKQNDTVPMLDALLQDDQGRPIDVTGAAVVFNMRNTLDDSVVVDNISSVIISAAQGEVRHTWLAAHTTTSGAFEAEFEVTFSDGTIQTFPNNGHILVSITEEVA